MASHVGLGGRWLEVGPGPGTLTVAAAERVDYLAAVELDERLACVAAAVAPANVGVAAGDGVAAVGAWDAEGVVSNTPYNASARIIAAAARNNSVARAVLGVQAEVAARLVAEPGAPDYGRLTLLARRYFRVRVVARLPASWFYPRPEVDGAVVVLERIRRWEPGDEAFEALTTCLFTGRNKLAYKMASRCACLDKQAASRRLAGKRVRDLEVGDVEWILEAGECTSGRGSG